MDDTTFDALTAAQSLREAGFEDRQAEAVAETVRDGRAELATKADLDPLATKADIAALETKIAELRAETGEKFAALQVDGAEREARFYRALWLQTGAIVGTVVAVAGVVVAVPR